MPTKSRRAHYREEGEAFTANVHAQARTTTEHASSWSRIHRLRNKYEVSGTPSTPFNKILSLETKLPSHLDLLLDEENQAGMSLLGSQREAPGRARPPSVRQIMHHVSDFKQFGHLTILSSWLWLPIIVTSINPFGFPIPKGSTAESSAAQRLAVFPSGSRSCEKVNEVS